MAYSKVTPNTQLPYPVDGQIVVEAEEQKRSDWSLQQFNEATFHGDGAISGSVNAAGDVTAGQWMVRGYYLTSAATQTPAGKVSGVRNYVVVRQLGTSWWKLTPSVELQVGSAWPTGGMVIGSYDVNAGGTVIGPSVVNTDLRFHPIAQAEISGNVALGVIEAGTALTVTMTHPAVSFKASEIQVAFTGQTNLNGLLVNVDAARTIGTVVVVDFHNLNSAAVAGTSFTVTVKRSGIVRDPQTAGLGGVSLAVSDKQGATAGAHNLLSATHGDTTGAAPVRGDVVTGQGATPKWQRLAVGGTNAVLRSDGVDATWAQGVARVATWELAITKRTVNYSIQEGDGVVLGDATAAPFTVTLPPVTARVGRAYFVKKIDSSGNAVIVDGSGPELIDNAGTKTLAAQNDTATVVCDGTQWWLF